MKLFKVLALLGAAASVCAQTPATVNVVTPTQCITSIDLTPLASGTLTVYAPGQNGAAAPFTSATGLASGTATRQISGGQIVGSLVLPNPAVTSPANVGYTFTIAGGTYKATFASVFITPDGSGNWNLCNLQAGNYQSAYPTVFVGSAFQGGNVPNATSFGSTVTLHADPTQDLQAATKKYVDDHGGMSWPTDPGVANYAGGDAWGASYTSSNKIPASLVSTLNQDTSGNAATATNFDHSPNQCSAGSVPTGITAHGDATGCAPISVAVDTRPNVTQSTGKNGFLPASGSYQIFNATGAGTITEVHVTLGASGTDTPNLVENSTLQIACDGNLQSVPFGLFFTAMDLPKPYNTDYLSIPVMSTTFPGTNNGAMVFNRRTWINFTSGCTMTLVNASATATANVFVDTTYKSGTPVAPPGTPTPRAYWNAYASSLPAVPPNSGTFNTPQVYLMPSSSLGTGEVEAITYFVNSSPNLNYLESGPVVICDGVICNQSGGGEDWGLTGYYGNYAANENVTSRGGFMAGTFLQTQQGGNDSLIYRRYDVQPVDNLPFASSLAVSSANGTSAISTSPSVAMSALTSFWTNNPTASVVQYSPAAGTFSSTQSVALTSYPAGATTCYRTDGVAPTATNGTCGSGSTTYSTAISVPSTTTIKAISSKSGFNNGILSSSLYTINSFTAPTYVGTCTQTATSAGSTVASCTMSVTAGDFALVMCRGGLATSSYTATSSPSSTFTQLSLASTSTGSSQASYVFGLAGGSTTFTCTAATSVTYQTLQVLDYHPGSLTSLATSQTNTIGSVTSTFTSAAINLTGSNFVIACGNAQYAASSETVGTINGSAATNRTVNGAGNSYCQDLAILTSASGVTGVLSAPPGGTWDGLIAAFH